MNQPHHSGACVNSSIHTKNAQHLTGSAMPATAIISSYAGRSADPLAIMEELKLKSTSVSGGDMELLEQMMLHQAVALQAMFMDLAVRAKGQQELAAVQALTQLALKAQSGSRATLQTLAELKNPRPVFVRQTNVAQNQQVNNGVHPPTRAKKQRNAPIELKAPTEENHGRPTLDTRAAATASRADSIDPTVGAVHRAAQRRG